MDNKKTSPALFVRQVRQELQKVTWPTRRDTFISSLIVILLIFLFSLFFLLSDQVWSFSIKKIIEIGSVYKMIKCRWYVLHAYSGYEKKVADSIVDQANKLGIADHIEEVSVPTQNIVEVKRGVRINTERKIFPGYILIKMNLNDDTWHIIKNTPKLSGFLGNKGKPVPISNAEAKRISEQVIDGVEKSRPAVMYDIGEQVKVIDGPFASFNGEIEQIDEEKARLRVAVSIFGRSTPVDLEYSQVEKA